MVVDCREPHTLADWWAQTLGWTVEPQDEAFVRRMIAEGHATQAETMTHNGALVWSSGSRGATFLHKANQGPHWWTTLADPEGNEFCVSD